MSFCHPQISLPTFCSIEEGTMQRRIDPSILEMALVGYQAELQKIQEKIAAIRKQLGGRVNIPVLAPAVSSGGSRPKRQMSAAGKRRIAEAQKKRWRKFHAKQTATTAKKAAPKRKLSPAWRATLAANLAKARAGRRLKKRLRTIRVLAARPLEHLRRPNRESTGAPHCAF